MHKLGLTDKEKEDVYRLIESGTPLPDKYRFLLFEDKKDVELIWSGKTTTIERTCLPFQTIEVVDHPRKESPTNNQISLSGIDNRGRQCAGWINKLIWGDNKLIMSSLKDDTIRKEIEKAGGLKLIYIDPPFDVGADFSINIKISDENLTKKPNILEELAYRDTWGKGADSFIAMLYERLLLMKNLLAADGSIYVHCDWRVNSIIRLLLDEVFGKQNFHNEIVVGCSGGNSSRKNRKFTKSHDTIFYYRNSGDYIWNDISVPYSENTEKNCGHDDRGRYMLDNCSPQGGGVGYFYGLDMGEELPRRGYSMPREKALELIKHGGLVICKGKVPRIKSYLDPRGAPCRDIWNDINKERGPTYPTQKPKALLRRIINASSNKGDLVADFFCGSGTTLVVAGELGRRWIGADIGKFAIHAARKRIMGEQRRMEKEGKDYRAFEILNLGYYDHQKFAHVNPALQEEQAQKQILQKEANFLELIIKAYKAEAVSNFKTFCAKKAGRYVAIGSIDQPTSKTFVKKVIAECVGKRITKVDILSFEYEMGLSPKIMEEAQKKGVSLALKHIPRDVFDKRAIENNQIQFHDASYVEIKLHHGKERITVELADFSVYHNQDIIDNKINALKKGSKRILLSHGNIIKISKDKDDNVVKEILTATWIDWVDYWAVDFDFESKKEIYRKKNEKTNVIEEKWTGDYIFENEWQSFRINGESSIDKKSYPHKYENKGSYKIAVKVVDILGNDTTTVVPVTIK